MAKIPTICVIVLSWNHKKDVLETLESLAKSNSHNVKIEICLVDNGSSDGTPEAAKKFFATLSKSNLSTKIINNSENLGFAAGNNVGMKWALKNGFDYVALLNDDTIVDKNLVEDMVLVHGKHQDVGAISPKIYFAKGYEFHNRYKSDEHGRVIWYAGGRIDWDNVYGTNIGVDEVDRGQFEGFLDTDFATGCFVVYKSQVLRDVGFYDERYFAYMEDADHAIRIKKAGYRVCYLGSVHLWHKVSQSSGIGSGLNDYYLTRNRMIFGLKYARLRTKFALIRESIKLLLNGRPWQKIGIRDYYLGKFYKGSWA